MILFLLLFGVAGAIPPLKNFEEGPCLQTNSTNISHTNISRQFLSTLKYAVGGSKYFMYLFPSSLPTYKNITEEEFINTACIQQDTNATDPSQPSTVYYFGEKITSAELFTSENINGTIVGPSAAGETYEAVAFTDGKTFAFLLTCWGKAKQRSWQLITSSPTISPSTKKTIEERAIQLGFKRENFVFLNFDKCKLY